MAEILSTVSLISFIVSGVCFILAVFIWFKFDILAVIGDLSGSTAKKSIARMRENNEKSGVKSYRSSATNVQRGKLTDTMNMSNKTTKDKKLTEKIKSEETGLLVEDEIKAFDANQTELLDTNQTELLDDENATALLVDENATELLNEEADLLVQPRGGKQLEMIESIMLIHTDEVIE